MVWMRELVLLGSLFSFSAPALASLDDHSHDGARMVNRGEPLVAGYPRGYERAVARRDDSCPSTNSSSQRAIAYYESWASRRKCNTFKPSDIDATRWTHINFAFANVSGSNEVAAFDTRNVDLYSKTTALKKQNEDLQVWIAVGGQGAEGFSNMASSSSSRKEFIKSAKQFMDKYGFDGLDIDWEYPDEDDRESLTALVKEMRQEFDDSKGISITVPIREIALKGFDLNALEPNLNFINMMSYDLEGKWSQPLVAQSGTNLTEIEKGVNLIKSKGISGDKLNLGLAFYGYTYTLEDSSCTDPGCPASRPGNPGSCSKANGTLHISEISKMVDNNKDIKPNLDKDAATMYFAWGDDQWVAYDNNKTLHMKTDFARKNCLGGSFAWAIDMENPQEKLTISEGPKQLPSQLVLAGALFSAFFFFM